MARFLFSQRYKRNIERIEDHLFKTTESVRVVSQFLNMHDAALAFLAENPSIGAVQPEAGEQSWAFCNGRYRVFYFTKSHKKELTIYLTHIIDNKELNQDIYPTNSIPTYEDDD